MIWWIVLLFTGLVFGQKICFQDLNGNGNFDIGSNEIQACDLGEDGTSYLCPIDRADCQLVGQCPSTCCWRGNPPVYNPSTGKCETDPGIQYRWAGRAVNPSNLTTDFAGYDASRDCFIDSSGNCLTPVADYTITMSAGYTYLPYLEPNQAGCVNTRAGIEIYVDGNLWDSWSVSQDPYCWGGKTFVFTASASKNYTFEIRMWGYTPEADTQMRVRVALSWYSAAENRWYTIGWPTAGYDLTSSNPYVYTYNIYLNTNDKFRIRFERHHSLFRGRVNGTYKYALVVTKPDGTNQFLGIKSCTKEWVAGWDGLCGNWGEFTADQDGDYRFRWMMYINPGNPAGLGDKTVFLTRIGFPSCHWQYPLNPDTGKCEASPTKLDWTCPYGNYTCVKLQGDDIPKCSALQCIDNPCGGSLP